MDNQLKRSLNYVITLEPDTEFVLTAPLVLSCVIRVKERQDAEEPTKGSKTLSVQKVVPNLSGERRGIDEAKPTLYNDNPAFQLQRGKEML